MWLIISIIEFVLLIVMSVIIRNLLIQNDDLELFISSVLTKTLDTLQHMKDIDESGAFAADDEVGHTFEDIKETINDYGAFLGLTPLIEEIRDEEKEG